MPKWTKEQEEAITKVGTNIIVSAGAGSGKTAVLTERVIRKLKNGVDISSLLILTFTNAAAKEMKDRIRNAIKKEGIDQLDKIDSSYITTFDSFALSIVKKYHYLMNLESNLEIGNDLILKFKKEEILDNIFNDLYESENKEFLNFIKDFSLRDDTLLKESILDIYNKLDLMYDKTTYLNNYINNYYNEEFINKNILDYLNIIYNAIDKIKNNLSEIELRVDGDYYQELLNELNNLLNSKSYDDIKKNINIKLPRLKKGMDDIKPYKDKISKLIKKIDKLTMYDSYKDIKNSIINTKKYVNVIINIILKLDLSFNDFKIKNNLYDFIDISKFAIKIVKENLKVKEELKNFFTEILVDEYQDTSDLQEEFINLIANNNVYMVGDIKQSIYRFRNANPNLFKEKYDNYQKNIGGYKIDLVKNFRSREETLNNINYIFNFIMDLELGGADYKNYHQMVFGNTTYLDYKPTNQDYNFQIYNYELENKEYSKDEIEAFITCKDILDKVNNNYLVYDKNLNKLRNITYDDFVILIDKSTSFDLYKKIFEYLKVPLTILKDETLSTSYDLYILKNILILLKSVKENKYDNNFKYAYLSIGRSYLFRMDDNTLYNIIKNNSFRETEIFIKINNLINYLDIIPVNMLINKIIDEFSFYEKLITVGNINDSIIRFDYLENLSLSLSGLSYTYIELIDYFNKMIDKNAEIKYSLNKDIKNSVKIMTIHKSKGLEYHICYYTGLTNKFNLSDSKKRFIFDNKLGFIIPNVNIGIINTIYHTLYKENYIKEDISEKIRLFYVALTRAKEKMILITSLKNEEIEEDELINIDTRLKYNSFSSILNSISDKLTNYIKNINLNDYDLSKDYNNLKKSNIKSNIIKTNEFIEVVEFIENIDLIKQEKFSKTNTKLITKDIKNNLEFGLYLHYLLEIIDLKNKNIDFIDNKYKKYIETFLNLDLFNNIDKANIYKEYEFIYKENNIKQHGIIDLMLEYDTYIDIIDYKLKNIDDLEYIKQLVGYKNYISNKTNKKVNLYLYSIINGIIKKID